MLEALNSLGGLQYEYADWYEDGRSGLPRRIRVSVVSEKQRRFETVAQNIVAERKNTALTTRFCYGYRPGQELYYRRQWWEIVSVSEQETAINPQALEVLGRNPNRITVLEVIRVS